MIRCESCSKEFAQTQILNITPVSIGIMNNVSKKNQYFNKRRNGTHFRNKNKKCSISNNYLLDNAALKTAIDEETQKQTCIDCVLELFKLYRNAAIHDHERNDYHFDDTQLSVLTDIFGCNQQFSFIKSIIDAAGPAAAGPAASPAAGQIYTGKEQKSRFVLAIRHGISAANNANELSYRKLWLTPFLTPLGLLQAHYYGVKKLEEIRTKAQSIDTDIQHCEYHSSFLPRAALSCKLITAGYHSVHPEQAEASGDKTIKRIGHVSEVTESTETTLMSLRTTGRTINKQISNLYLNVIDEVRGNSCDKEKALLHSGYPIQLDDNSPILTKSESIEYFLKMVPLIFKTGVLNVVACHGILLQQLLRLVICNPNITDSKVKNIKKKPEVKQMFGTQEPYDTTTFDQATMNYEVLAEFLGQPENLSSILLEFKPDGTIFLHNLYPGPRTDEVISHYQPTYFPDELELDVGAEAYKYDFSSTIPALKSAKTNYPIENALADNIVADEANSILHIILKDGYLDRLLHGFADNTQELLLVEITDVNEYGNFLANTELQRRYHLVVTSVDNPQEITWTAIGKAVGAAKGAAKTFSEIKGSNKQYAFIKSIDTGTIRFTQEVLELIDKWSRNPDELNHRCLMPSIKRYHKFFLCTYDFDGGVRAKVSESNQNSKFTLLQGKLQNQYCEFLEADVLEFNDIQNKIDPSWGVRVDQIPGNIDERKTRFENGKKTTQSILTKLLSINTQVELPRVIQAITNVVTRNNTSKTSQKKIREALQGFTKDTQFKKDLSSWCQSVGLTVSGNNVYTNNTVIQKLNTEIFKPANSATTDCVVCHRHAGSSHGMGSDKHHSCRSCGGRICSKTECAIPNFDFWQYPGELFWDYDKTYMGMGETTKTRVEVPKLENQTVDNQTKYKGWICRTCYNRIIPKESSNANNTRTDLEKKHEYLLSNPKIWKNRLTPNSTKRNIARITNEGTTCEICSKPIGIAIGKKAWDWCRRCGMIVCKDHLTKRKGALLKKHISDGSHVIKNHAGNRQYNNKEFQVCNMCIRDDDVTTNDSSLTFGGKKQRKTHAKKSTVKKSTAKKPTAKKSTAKKPTAKKSTAKKPTVKKPTAKKPTVKKPTVKKPTAKKPTAKKSTVKKPTAKKSTVKKPTVKKPTVKKPTIQKTVKKIRKHKGIYQTGPKKGKLKPGFKYSGKKTKTGLKIIVKVKK